jgi:hypothetical protein
LIDYNAPEWTLTELRIAKAYLRLCAIPEDSPEASVSLASISGHEIRMLAGPAVDLDSAPLFWLELFDHSSKTSVDSFCCHRLKDAVPVVRDFFAHVDDMNKTGDTCW